MSQFSLFMVKRTTATKSLPDSAHCQGSLVLLFICLLLYSTTAAFIVQLSKH